MPHGFSRSSVPRAAFSHSGSVGSLPPIQAQYADAAAHETYVTGHWACSADLSSNLSVKVMAPATMSISRSRLPVVGSKFVPIVFRYQIKSSFVTS